MSKEFRVKSSSNEDNLPYYCVLPREVKAVNTDLGVLPSDTVNIPDVVKWPHPECTAYLQSLEGHYNLEDWVIPKLKDVALYRHVYRLKSTLLWWWSLPIPKKIGNPYGIMRENLKRGPAYADELDDSIKYSMRLSASCALVYGKEEYPVTCTEVKDVDQFFSPFHLIPFERPPSGDIDLLFKDPPLIPEKLLTQFKEKVEEFIRIPSENRRVLDDMDSLRMMGSVSAFDPSTNRRIPKVASRLSQKGQHRTTSNFMFDYVKVDKAPHESRECVVPSAETSASLQLLRLQLHQVLKVPSDVIWEKDFSWLPDWLSYNQKALFIMSDQKKCGLTFPLELLKALFGVLEERFPEWDFGLIRGYDNAFLKLGKGDLRQIRGGPGLGQLSEAISASVAILFEIWKDQFTDIRVEGRFFNDDQVIRVYYNDLRQDPIQPWVIDMAQSWDVHMESYGLQVHKKKPFICGGGVFLEVYGESFPITVQKKVQWVGHFFSSLCQSNIALAKEYFANMYDNIFDEEKPYGEYILFNTVLPFWGYEFYPQEVYLPYQLGGWFRRRSFNKLDLLFTQIDKVPKSQGRLVNLIGLEIPKPHGGTKLEKEFRPQVRKVQKSFKALEDGKPATWNYPKLARSGLDSFRPSSQEYVKYGKRLIKARRAAISKKARTYKEIFSLYWKLTIEEGKAYAPPLSVYHEGTNWLPFGKTLEEGNPPPREDPSRAWFKLCQELGTLSWQFQFWTRSTYSGIQPALYAFISSLNIKDFIITPETINLIMVLGESNLKKILDYGMQTYGKIILPKLSIQFPELELLYNSAFEDLIYLDHEAFTSYLTGINYNLSPELFRVKKSLVETINSLCQSNPNWDHVSFGELDDLRQILRPPNIAGPATFAHPTSTSVQPPHEVAEEDRYIMAAILAQVYAPAHLAPEEEVIRQGLAGQIYGRAADVPDIFDEEDDWGLGFGD